MQTTDSVAIADYSGRIVIETEIEGGEEEVAELLDEVTRIIAESQKGPAEDFDAMLNEAERCSIYEACKVSREVQLPNGSTLYFHLTAKLKKVYKTLGVKRKLNEAADLAVAAVEAWAPESEAVGSPAW